jgi:hypothetical protein
MPGLSFAMQACGGVLRSEDDLKKQFPACLLGSSTLSNAAEFCRGDSARIASADCAVC